MEASLIINLNLASNLLHVFSMTYTASYTDDTKTISKRFNLLQDIILHGGAMLMYSESNNILEKSSKNYFYMQLHWTLSYVYILHRIVQKSPLWGNSEWLKYLTPIFQMYVSWTMLVSHKILSHFYSIYRGPPPPKNVRRL